MQQPNLNEVGALAGCEGESRRRGAFGRRCLGSPLAACDGAWVPADEVLVTSEPACLGSQKGGKRVGAAPGLGEKQHLLAGPTVSRKKDTNY